MKKPSSKDISNYEKTLEGIVKGVWKSEAIRRAHLSNLKNRVAEHFQIPRSLITEGQYPRLYFLICRIEDSLSKEPMS